MFDLKPPTAEQVTEAKLIAKNWAIFQTVDVRTAPDDTIHVILSGTSGSSAVPVETFLLAASFAIGSGACLEDHLFAQFIGILEDAKRTDAILMYVLAFESIRYMRLEMYSTLRFDSVVFLTIVVGLILSGLSLTGVWGVTPQWWMPAMVAGTAAIMTWLTYVVSPKPKKE